MKINLREKNGKADKESSNKAKTEPEKLPYTMMTFDFLC